MLFGREALLRRLQVPNPPTAQPEAYEDQGTLQYTPAKKRETAKPRMQIPLVDPNPPTVQPESLL